MEQMLRLKVITPEKSIIDATHVQDLYFKTDSGMIGVFPGHAPMIASLGVGTVLFTQNDTAGFLKVSGGVATVDDDVVTLLVDIGEEASTIDLDRAKRSLERAEGRLAAKELSNIDIKRAQSSKMRAVARIEAIDEYSKIAQKSSPEHKTNKN